MKLVLNQRYKSLPAMQLILPDFTVITGENGSGKSQLFESIMSEQAKIYLENEGNISLVSGYFRLITNSSFNTTNTRDITPQEINEKYRELWQEFQQYRYSKNDPHSDFYVSGLKVQSFKRMSENVHKPFDDISFEDFVMYYPNESIQEGVEIFQNTLGYDFKLYMNRYEQNEFNSFKKSKGNYDAEILTEEDFVRINGPRPWEVVNKLFLEAGIDFEVNNPEQQNSDTPFTLILTNKNSGLPVNFDGLSSGEKTIMSLCLALFKKKESTLFPAVLLMDEPDAFLHPSMIKHFLKVIQEVFVKEYKIKVVLITHSPTTVALADTDEIYLMTKTGSERLTSVNKDVALKKLTEGVPSLSINYRNRKQIFTESRYDAEFYEKIYILLDSQLDPEISLSFISSSDSRKDVNGKGVGTCDQVKLITKTLRNGGNSSIWGIIDYDNINKSSESIAVLGNGNRYSIENYLLDPVLVCALMLNKKIIKAEELGLSNNEKYLNIQEFTDEQFQTMVDKFLKKIEGVTDSRDKECIQTKNLNGNIVSIPKWYLYHHGHTLEEKIVMVYKQLNSVSRIDDLSSLKRAIIDVVVDDMPGLMSEDFSLLFSKIQYDL